MPKLTILVLLSLIFSSAFAQKDILILKKRGRTIQKFWTGTTIAFQLKDKQWRKGEIMKIRNDSFYIRPMVVYYSIMGTDTVYHPITGYSIGDIGSLPKRGYLVAYKDGRFQISGAGGHVHFYWIKSGWLFRTGGAGYAGLHIANELLNDKFTFSDSKTQLTTAAGVFLGGVLLKKIYKVTLPIRKKYRVESFSF